MLQAEQKRQEESNKRVTAEREKKRKRKDAHALVLSRQHSKHLIAGMKNNVYRHLSDVGFFTNTFKELVIEQNVLPWLDQMTQDFVDEIDATDLLPDEVLYQHMDSVNDIHSMTVVDE